MPRIGINALYLIPGAVGGTEIYLRELLAAMARIDSTNDYFVFSNAETGVDLVPRQVNFHWKPQAVHARIRPARILWEQSILPLEASRYRLDVMFNPGFTAPLFAPCPCVTVFHDLQHKRHPEHFRWFDLPFWNALLWASAHRSRKLIAVSQATREDLAHFYPFTKGRVETISHGVDQAFFELKRGKLDPFVLCVSTLHPHKNLDRLIRAYARSKRDYRLVIAGLRGFYTAPIEKLIADLYVGDLVELTGWIDRATLLGLYGRAKAFVFPSTFEGFGMPVLEAMAAGIPVACSKISPLTEIGGDAVLYFDPQDENAIEAALARIVNDTVLREKLIVSGPERAREFTWQSAAEKTLAALVQPSEVGTQ